MNYIIEFLLLLAITFTSLVMGLSVENYYRTTDEVYKKSILNLFGWYTLFVIVLIGLVVWI